ncbi:hypothetical protein, partial [Azonexus fungiphilus]|uniref:hypothetical protein n=1 Tax=Azonexus fungiphilus TaxID=146940 RepID=UPI001B8745AC
FVQKFAADGTLSGSAVQLEAIGKTNGADLGPKVTAVGSSGEYVVTWFGIDSAGDNSIFVQKFAADGTLSGSAVQLEAIGSTTGVDQSPQVTAVGSSGEYVVTWYGIDSAGDYSIFVQKFAADGTLSGSAVQLEAIGKTNGADLGPQVTAVGSSGEYVVTWYGEDSAGDNSIFVQKFNADGTIGQSEALTVDSVTSDGILSEAELAEGVLITGTVLAGSSVKVMGLTANVNGTTWSCFLDANTLSTWQSGNRSLLVSAVTAEGVQTLVSAPVLVDRDFGSVPVWSYSPVQLEAIGNTTGSDQAPQVTAVGSSGEYVVTWHGQDSASDNSIFVQKFAADGTLSGSAVQLEAIGKTNGADFNPQVTAVGSSGEYVVTWYGIDSAGDNSIFVQKFAADGTLSGSAVQLEAISKTNGA